MTPGTLYLIPNTLGDTSPGSILAAPTLDTIRSLRHFVVENAKTARAFLKQIDMPVPIAELAMTTLNVKTGTTELAALLAPLLAGHDAGILSEAGCPGIADPGADLVRIAHKRDIRVVPLVGPSSILLALMASGLNGQQFAFHGYLPIDKQQRIQAIAELERESAKKHQTQACIETPYRNTQLAEALIATLDQSTLLCIATDLTLPTEWIRTQAISTWRKEKMPNLKDRPSIFAFLTR